MNNRNIKAFKENIILIYHQQKHTIEMDLVEDICREYNLTHETVQYISNVYQISQAFRNTPLRRLDHVSDLTNISMRMLRRIGRGLGIVNVNSIPVKSCSKIKFTMHINVLLMCQTMKHMTT